MSQSSYSQSLDNFRLVAFCPLCNAQYQPNQASILEQKDDANLIYVECSECGASIIALVVMGLMGISSIGLVTDLTERDIRRFQNAYALSSDDVLDLHQALQQKNAVVALIAGE
ncbi:MAG TPA: hypothetical protein VJB93_03455 [Patescibacteria group bacterium]|nr:hypothetical protein [Patescibacteria group bacterium]